MSCMLSRNQLKQGSYMYQQKTVLWRAHCIILGHMIHTSAYWKIILLFLNQNYIVGTPKNRLTETVLWSIQNMFILLSKILRTITRSKKSKSGPIEICLREKTIVYMHLVCLWMHFLHSVGGSSFHTCSTVQFPNIIMLIPFKHFVGLL